MLARTPFKQKRHAPAATVPRITKWPPALAVRASAAINPIAVDVVSQPKTVEHRNPALLAMARGKRCLLCVPGVCNGDQRTVVAAHSNWAEHGKSGARKADDMYSVWSCSACHSWLDQGKSQKQEKKLAFALAHIDQVLAWQRIAGDMSHTPKDRKAAHWALCLLESTLVNPDENTPVRPLGGHCLLLNQEHKP